MIYKDPENINLLFYSLIGIIFCSSFNHTVFFCYVLANLSEQMRRDSHLSPEWRGMELSQRLLFTLEMIFIVLWLWANSLYLLEAKVQIAMDPLGCKPFSLLSPGFQATFKWQSENITDKDWMEWCLGMEWKILKWNEIGGEWQSILSGWNYIIQNIKSKKRMYQLRI